MRYSRSLSLSPFLSQQRYGVIIKSINNIVLLGNFQNIYALIGHCHNLFDHLPNAEGANNITDNSSHVFCAANQTSFQPNKLVFIQIITLGMNGFHE